MKTLFRLIFILLLFIPTFIYMLIRRLWRDYSWWRDYKVLAELLPEYDRLLNLDPRHPAARPALDELGKAIERADKSI